MELWKKHEAMRLLGAKKDNSTGRYKLTCVSEYLCDELDFELPTMLVHRMHGLMTDGLRKKMSAVVEVMKAPTRAAYMEKKNGTKKES